MKEYNDFILKLQGREHDKRSIPILNQSGTPETLGWLLSKANTVPDNVAIEWLVGAMMQIADRLQERADWPFDPIVNIEPQLRIILRQLTSVTLKEMAVSFPWPTREMGGAEVLPIRSMQPEEKNKWLQQLFTLISTEKSKGTASRSRSPSSSRFEAPRSAPIPRSPSPSPSPSPSHLEPTLQRSNAARAPSPLSPVRFEQMSLTVPNGNEPSRRPRSLSSSGDASLVRLLSVTRRPGQAMLADAMSLALFRVDE